MLVGKWHLDNEPTDRGFEKYFGHLSGSTNFFTGNDTFRLNGNTYNVPDKDFYTTDVMTDYALDFLDAANEEKPFFLYIAYNAPHYPLHVKEEDFRNPLATVRSRDKTVESWWLGRGALRTIHTQVARYFVNFIFD